MRDDEPLNAYRIEFYRRIDPDLATAKAKFKVMGPAERLTLWFSTAEGTTPEEAKATGESVAAMFASPLPVPSSQRRPGGIWDREELPWECE